MLPIMGGSFLVLVCLDMGIKQYVEDTYEEQEERETAIDKIVFRKVYNRGFLLNALEKYPKLVKGASAAAGAGIILYDAQLLLKKGRFFQKAGMLFITAGAVSNIYDRLIRRKVIDYIGIRSKNRFLARITANLADLYVAAGTVIMAAAGWKKR